MVIYFLKNLVKIKEISLGVAASYNEARKAIVCGFSLSHTHIDLMSCSISMARPSM